MICNPRIIIIKYSHDGGITGIKMTFLNGNYSYSDINSYIECNVKNRGHSANGIKITFVSATSKVYIELETNYQLDLRAGNFGELIGFTIGIASSAKYGDKLLDITRPVDDVFIHADIVSDSIVPAGNMSNVIY